MLNATALNILIVEDEYLIALDLARALQRAGVHVLGPVGSVAEAIDFIRDANGLNGAILDIQLSDEKVFPVADALAERGIPFIFTTGYHSDVLPERYRGVTRFEKPVDAEKVMRAIGAVKPAQPASQPPGQPRHR